MTGEEAPAWDLATLKPDGAVGASASGGRAVLLARALADEHQGRIAGYGAAELARVCGQLERVHEALTVSYAFSMLYGGADRAVPAPGARRLASDRRDRPGADARAVRRARVGRARRRARRGVLADPVLARFGHWLRAVRRDRRHGSLGPEPEPAGGFTISLPTRIAAATTAT